MPGLKAIADPLKGTAQSRAVSWHAAGVGISGTASFAVAGLVSKYCGSFGLVPSWRRNRVGAVLIAAMVMPSRLAVPSTKALSRRLLDFRAVLRNRAAMGRIIGYTVHTWELSALRAWGVTFLAAVCASQGAPSWLPDPTALFTAAGLVGIAVSVTGNETAQRWGRARVVTVAMSTAAVLSPLTGWSASATAISTARP